SYQVSIDVMQLADRYAHDLRSWMQHCPGIHIRAHGRALSHETGEECHGPFKAGGAPAPASMPAEWIDKTSAHGKRALSGECTPVPVANIVGNTVRLYFHPSDD